MGENREKGRGFFLPGGGDRAGLQGEAGARPLSQKCSRVLGGLSTVILFTFTAAPVGLEPDLLEPFWQK